MKNFVSRALLSIGIAGMLSANALASGTAPTEWPTEYKWHEYSSTASQPVRNGRVETYLAGTNGDGFTFDSLPFQHAIVRVRGNGARKVAFIMDPLCPYSREYERNLNKLDDVTIYTFVVPVLDKQAGSRNWEMSERIACEPDNQTRAQTYENWIVAGISPPDVVGCENGIRSVLSALNGAYGHDSRKSFDSTSPATVFDVINLAMTGAHEMDFVEHILDIAYQ